MSISDSFPGGKAKYEPIAKYELLKDQTITVARGRTLYRVRAVRDFGDIKAGQIGGYIEAERNLSHDGRCWVGGDARVFDDAQVFENAQVLGEAQICGEADIFGSAIVSGTVLVGDGAKVCGNAQLGGSARIWDYTVIGGDDDVSDPQHVPKARPTI